MGAAAAAYVGAMMLIDRLGRLIRRQPLVSVVRLHGAVGAAGRFGGGLSDAGLAPLLERAFRRGRPAAVALSINSPGGSPVQSSLIAARIRRLAEETETPVLAFCEDAAASGGYWIASAADEIWADAASIVGSIGVISAGFGFTGLIDRWGIERRVHTAGSEKSMLDPFRPQRPEDLVRLERLLSGLHAQFIAQVRTRRGDRLKGEDPFTGEIWLGAEAVGIGLIDGIGHLVPVLKARFGDKLRFQMVEPRRSLVQRLGGAGAGLAAGAVEAAEERALWARLGV